MIGAEPTPHGPVDVTLYDRIEPLSRAPESLARVSVKQFDPRFVEPDVWPAVKDLLAYIREEAERERKPSGRS